jgi:hypothetical protein
MSILRDKGLNPVLADDLDGGAEDRQCRPRSGLT